MDTNKYKGGLQELPLDPNRFSLGKVVAYPKLEDLPDTFEVEPLSVQDQRSSDMCAAFAGASTSGEQEGVELSAEYVFAMSKELTGDVNSWGQHLDAIAKTLVKIGAIEKKDAPYSIDNQTSEFLRDPKNWDEGLKIKALIHAKGSYMDCKGPYSAFDNLRSVIWIYRNEKKFPFLGVEWGWSVNEAYLKEPLGGFGHALRAFGWRRIGDEDFLSIVNSYGKNAGDNGKFYLSRKIIDTYVPKYGAEILTDMTKEEYQSRLKSLGQSWVLRALNAVLRVLGILAVQMQKTPPTPQILPNPTPVIPVLPPEPSTTPFSPTIVKWASAIEIMENSPKEWNNPGAIKNYNGEFIKFSSHQIGFDYLCDYLTRACTGKHLAYPKGGETTLIEFQKIYSPSNDGNNPLNYATFVAGKLGITIETKIGTFV